MLPGDVQDMPDRAAAHGKQSCERPGGVPETDHAGITED